MITESRKKLLSWFLQKSLPVIICSTILAFSIVKAASILSERPVTNTFNGTTIASGNNAYSELMGTDQLMAYLNLYPSMGALPEEYDMNQYDETVDEYDRIVNQRRLDLEKVILNGEWPAFPYVQLNDQLYFSKEAVDEWFFEQGKQHLVVK